MKTKLIKKEEKKEFKPFKVEFACETIKDAELLYHVCNEGYIIRAHTNHTRGRIKDILEVNETLYEQIKKEITSQGFDI